MNLVQLRSLLSWQCKLDSDHLLHKISFQMGSTDWEGKSKNLFGRKLMKHMNKHLSDCSTTLFFGKTCAILRNFTFISHTYLDAFLDSWRCFVNEAQESVVNLLILYWKLFCSFAQQNVPWHAQHTCTYQNSPHSYPTRNRTPHPGTAAKQQGRSSADRSTNFLCFSLSNVWKIARQVTAVFSTSSPMPT